MYDLHSHIVWEVDDGSKSWDMSQQMLRTAAETGTQTIFATSHIIEHRTRPSWELMQERVAQLNALATEEGLAITVHPGGEVYMNWDLLDHLCTTKDYRLAHSQYMLVELPMREIPVYAEDFLYELRVAGVTPILAHPERYGALLKDTNRLLQWRKDGLLLQVNAGSLIGFYGRRVQARARWLLENNLLDFIGSDAHSTTGRTTNITEARKVLAELGTEDQYLRLTKQNPECIISNREIPIHVPTKVTTLKVPGEKKSIWARLFG